MSGRHSFQEVIESFSLERRQKVEAIKEELVAEMPEVKIAVTNYSQMGESENAQPGSCENFSIFYDA